MLLINLKTEQRKKNYSLISELLLDKIDQALQKKQKVVLFHNRKGYARRIICVDCKHVWICEKCERPMISQQNQEQALAVCYQCKTKKQIYSCPKCRGTNWKFSGYGLKKIKEDLEQKLSKNVKIKISNAKPLPKKDRPMAEISNNDIFLSTQPPLIYECPDTATIGLAAILNADTDFYLPDFASAAKTFNRIIRFKKFCRELKISTKIVQSYCPKHPAIFLSAKGDYQKFKAGELASRKTLNYPPYGRLIKLIYQHKNQTACKKETQLIYNKIKNLKLKIKNLSLSPPQPAFVPIVRGNFRWQIIIKTQSSKFKTQNQNVKLKTFLKQLSPQWLIDVDPISLL